MNATGNPGCTLFNSECTISAGNTLRIGPVTDRGNRLQRPQALDSATAAGLGRATPHASPRLFAADDVTTETYYHGHD